jgi:3-methyladenine DNA glycosylase AlkC
MRTHTLRTQRPLYSREAVQQCINTSRQRISKREASLIHSLLAGWEHTQTQTFAGMNHATQKTNTQPN